jgi:hypothetical protein
MTQRGFRLSQSEDRAELVIIPQLIQPMSRYNPSKPTNATPSIHLFNSNIGEPGMMQNGEALGELPLSENRPAPPRDQIQLMVTAVQLDDWRKALIVNQLRIPQVWRISVVAPTDFCLKGKEVKAELVQAAGPWFAQLATLTQQINPPFGLHWAEGQKEMDR